MTIRLGLLQRLKPRLGLYWLLVFLSVCSSGGGPVFADAISDQRAIYSLGIHYYDVDPGLCGVGTATEEGAPVDFAHLVVPAGDTDPEKVWSFLKGHGLSSEQAAGVMGNMRAESGLGNPGARPGQAAARHQGTKDVWNSNFEKNAWGLVQWDGGRRYTAPDGGILGALRKYHPELVNYTDVSYDLARNQNVTIPEPDADAMLTLELNYLYQESNSRSVNARGFGDEGNEWKTLLKQDTVEKATVFWHNNFEVSGDSAETVMKNRGGFAQEFFDTFKDATITSSVDCPQDGFANTVLAFAWPDYVPARSSRTGEGHSSGRDPLLRKPEYAQAIDISEQNGIYVGNDHGIDCGGFITNLMIYSKYEPNYNYAGMYANGAGNTINQRKWMREHWQKVGDSATIDPATLKPGDVAISDDHTFVWVGTIEGFGSQIASASTGEGYKRAPEADTYQLATAPGFEWYHKP